MLIPYCRGSLLHDRNEVRRCSTLEELTAIVKSMDHEWDIWMEEEGEDDGLFSEAYWDRMIIVVTLAKVRIEGASQKSQL